MRLPDIKNYDDSVEIVYEELPEMSIPRPYFNLTNKKDLNKFIETCESIIRTSVPYREFTKYLSGKMGMEYCSFFHKVSKNMNGSKISIEQHHEPFTLYDIVAIVLIRKLSELQPEERVEMLDIVDEVLALHYEGLVGLVPLSVTVHELVHSGRLFIPLQFIDEGFNIFYNRYEEEIRREKPELLKLLIAKLDLSRRFEENPDEFIAVLKKKYIYVVNEGYESIPEKLEEKNDDE